MEKMFSSMQNLRDEHMYEMTKFYGFCFKRLVLCSHWSVTGCYYKGIRNDLSDNVLALSIIESWNICSGTEKHKCVVSIDK